MKLCTKFYGDCNLQSGWKVSKIEEREERIFFVMLTSQLRECKQMEGCVPQGGTAPRASNCKIGFYANIY